MTKVLILKDITRFFEGSYHTKKRRSKGVSRSIAITMISFYQHHISPRKGYCCAYRVVHGGDSCSQYVKNVLADKSLFESTLLARRRFRDCTIAHISAKNRVVDSKDSVMVSVGGDDIISIIIGFIMWIITAILAFIFGRNSGCCK